MIFVYNAFVYTEWYRQLNRITKEKIEKENFKYGCSIVKKKFTPCFGLFHIIQNTLCVDVHLVARFLFRELTSISSFFFLSLLSTRYLNLMTRERAGNFTSRVSLLMYVRGNNVKVCVLKRPVRALPFPHREHKYFSLIRVISFSRNLFSSILFFLVSFRTTATRSSLPLAWCPHSARCCSKL